MRFTIYTRARPPLYTASFVGYNFHFPLSTHLRLNANLSQRNIMVSAEGDAYLSNFDFQPVQDPVRGFDHTHFDLIGRWNAPESSLTARNTKTDVYSYAMFAFEVSMLQF